MQPRWIAFAIAPALSMQIRRDPAPLDFHRARQTTLAWVNCKGRQSSSTPQIWQVACVFQGFMIRAMATTALLVLGFLASGCGGGGGSEAQPAVVTVASVAAVAAPAASTLDITPVFFSGGTVNLNVIEDTATVAAPITPGTTQGTSADAIAATPVVANLLPATQAGTSTVSTSSAAMSSDVIAVGEGMAIASLMPANKATTPKAPKNSDVVFSPRFDRADAATVASAYQATRTEWSYIKKAASISALRSAVGPRIGGSINNNTPTANSAGAAIDFDGAAIVAPWMKSWGAIWNSCATPEGLQALKTAAAELIALGVNSIQMDDPGMQLDSEYFGAGDFSASSLRGFGTWVEQQRAAGATMPLTAAEAADYKNWLRTRYAVTSAADYLARRDTFNTTSVWRNYMRATVAGCLGQLRSSIAAGSGGSVTLSMNIHTPYPWGSNAFLLPFADYVVGEVDGAHDDFQQIYFFANWLRSEGRRWEPVFPVSIKAEQRRKIAMSYAVGANPIVPWDMWVPPATASSAVPDRYFGAPADFADLYIFVRANAVLLDDFDVLSRLNLVIYSNTPRLAEVQAQLKRLADLQVPYAASLRSSSWALPPGRAAAGVNRTLRLFNDTRYPADTYALVNAESDASLSELAVTSSATPGVSVLVTANQGQPTKRVVHVLRSTDGDTGSGPATITLNEWPLPLGTRYSVKIHQPGLATTNLGTLNKSADSRLMVTVPKLAEWALLEIDAQ